ncbi:50S ribosomal protein L11 methyltransferase [Abyssibius alkaniclasticus]|uniref:50S ribosomal protein L11 methyltransferase n=1 Tax=Abyssibius alkaniclasticus TaxID=2881234 RepID=UPI002363EB9D|nr:50S ribosomal protein L11 methyltransferase [Abyssibius alkaniclasticus]UPH71487.1 50S ribosomal protein L11 methyltransferase [Abyssibius alkaniclasticus]|tara:strand:+ start:539 stop:1399 length:861 start_codon:yes stop_codon:yes gene_type:complete
MATWTALTTLKGEAFAQALADASERLDPVAAGIFEIEDGRGFWEVGVYFTEKPDDVALDLLAAAHGAKPFVISRVEDRDWVAQVRRELTPVYAGRFVVFGSHDRDTVPKHLIGLEIEAAMAFGTGHHGTTQGCLMALDDLLRKGFVARNVADIGSGTGVLAMAAARAYPAAVLASDIDQVATDTARANIIANGLAGRIATVTAVGFRAPIIRARAPFDLIFANILAMPLRKMAPDMAAHTAPGSMLVLSGILNRQATGVEKVYEGFGFLRQQRREIGEWTTLVLRR